MDSRNTYVLIDVDNYISNLDFFRKYCEPAKIMPVLKANAYGHGAVVLSKVAEKAGYDFFAVAFLEEAIELRKNGISSDILVLNFVAPEMLQLAEEMNITITLYGFQQLERYKTVPFRPKAHIEIDTGMRRIGIEPEEADDFFKQARNLGFYVEGAYTHLSVADELKKESREFTEEQISKFLKYVPDVNIRHVCNTAAAIQKLGKCFDYVRVGIGSYGLNPSGELYLGQLKPVLSWKTIVSHVKWVKKGDGISYGRTYIAPNDMKIATVPVGYADGYWRNLSNRGQVLIKGTRCKIVGKICMDQFMVDVSHLQNISIGDEVVLIGEQDNEQITAEEIAKLAGTINYEVTSRIGNRVLRVFVGSCISEFEDYERKISIR